jgi:hypothetical protein
MGMRENKSDGEEREDGGVRARGGSQWRVCPCSSRVEV